MTSEGVDVIQGVDLSKPIVWQVLGMSADTYHAWLNAPNLGRNAPSMRFFASDVMEGFSKSKWWYIPLYSFPAMWYFIKWSIPDVGVVATAVSFVVGLLLWTFVEYLLHRFLFHGFEKLSIFTHFFLHGVHHVTPQDTDRLVFPPVMIAGLCCVVYPILKCFGPYQWGVGAGVALGYFVYDSIHFYTHHSKPNTCIGPLKSFRQYHMNHHFANHDVSFGVSSPLWDYVFGTVGTWSVSNPKGKKIQ